MTEPFPRRPRVLGSPRSVALAKEGVPPEWEPGCGAPRRRRPVGRERQPGATGHVTSRARASDEARGSAPGDRPGTGRGLAQGERVVSPVEGVPRARWRTGRGARRRLPRGRSAPGSVIGQSGWKSGSRACAGAPTSETAKKAAAIRLPCVRRRVPPVTWEPLTSPAAPARGARPSRRTPPRRRRARPRICGGRPKRSTSRIGPVHASCPVELRRGPGGGDGRDRRAKCGRRRIARIVSQGFHRLFGGECSGSSGYIVVAAGREDSRGLGSPMTEFLPRRPRVLGSPRLVALAKEGVPPEWEPGCGAPRRRRPVGRERQPGATGHVIFGRRGGTQSRWQSRQQK